jgi:lysozyme
MLLGVDVSHHQQPDAIDWTRLAEGGVAFAFMRATYGVQEDATFLDHVDNARRAGIVIGAYHFLRFKTSQPAESQAEAFLEALEPLAPHANVLLPPVLDLEDNRYDDPIGTAAERRRYVTMANVWLQIVEQRLGRLAMIYTRASFFDGDLDSPAGFGVRPLWVAHYTTLPSPRLPAAWSRYHFWQFTESGRMSGYRGDLDLNRFDGDQEDLETLARSAQFPERFRFPADVELRRSPLERSTATRRVASKGLNLRSDTVVSDATFVVALPLGHEVEVIASGVRGRWAEVRTFIGDVETTGFVVESYLRPLERDTVEDLVTSAVTQWHRFKRGAGHETAHPYYLYVGEMWQELGLPYDGRDTAQFWSAAAISYFVNHAGPAYDAFRRNQRHSVYIHDAITKRLAGNRTAPFWGFRLNEEPVAVGDIVCMWREFETTFDDAIETGQFPGHTDLIVGISNGVAITLGGNVSQSVATKEFALDDDGFLVPTGTLFAIMKNRT